MQRPTLGCALEGYGSRNSPERVCRSFTGRDTRKNSPNLSTRCRTLSGRRFDRLVDVMLVATGPPKTPDFSHRVVQVCCMLRTSVQATSYICQARILIHTANLQCDSLNRIALPTSRSNRHLVTLLYSKLMNPAAHNRILGIF